jgi:hypothetical protein
MADLVISVESDSCNGEKQEFRLGEPEGINYMEINKRGCEGQQAGTRYEPFLYPEPPDDYHIDSCNDEKQRKHYM